MGGEEDLVLIVLYEKRRTSRCRKRRGEGGKGDGNGNEHMTGQMDGWG
jgi:hypothetical protein